MSLIRFNPRRDLSVWRPFSELQAEINRLFGDVLHEAPVAASGFAPPVDVFEKDDRLIVKADLPGIKREDIQVTAHDGVLTIRGSREHQEEVKEDGYRYVERVSGSFSRTLQLPVEVDTNKISAEYRDGVLTIEAPKVPAAIPRSVEVKVG